MGTSPMYKKRIFFNENDKLIIELTNKTNNLAEDVSELKDRIEKMENREEKSQRKGM